MKKGFKRVALAGFLVLIISGLYLALQDKPVSVDVAKATQAPMQVTIDEEGVTRVRDVYTVSSPLSGHLSRIALREGDTVSANDTLVASIHPLDPPFIDERSLIELEAVVRASEAAVALAKVERERAQTALNLAQSNYRRAVSLGKTNDISESQLESTYSEMQLQKAFVASSDAQILLREAELASAQARLAQPENIDESPSSNACCVPIHAPVNGVILKVYERSEQAISAGMPLVDIGDAKNLEITLDLLSRDAVQIEKGTVVTITDWGGEQPFSATVATIEPAGFTKISALGIEEQRVSVVLSMDTVPEKLGHGFRVFARLIVWQDEKALQVPIGALFRSAGSWSVFAVNDEDTVELRAVTIGKMNDTHAQINNGLADGVEVVLYPNDQLEHGSLVERRVTIP